MFHTSGARITVNFSDYDSTQIFSPGDALMVHPRPNSGTGASAAGSPVRAPSLSLPAGFTSDTSQAPASGTWHANGTTTVSEGYANDAAGSTLQRVWTITRSCSQTCTYTLIRPFVGGNGVASVIRTKLVHGPDGWRATWPAQRLTCGGTATDPIYWNQQEVWILRFIDGGRVAQADESRFSYTPLCGYGRASVTWRATFANSSTRTNNLTTG
jgi:hypothetical protein